MARSPLQKFALQHPHAEVVVARIFTPYFGAPAEYEPVEIRWGHMAICSHSRRRDAYRALRRAGFYQEGLFWRRMPAQERLVETVETIDVGDWIGDL